MAGLHIVSDNPWIIHGYNFGNIFSPVKQLAPYLSPPKTERIHFILTLNWSLLPAHKFQSFHRAYLRHKRRYPNLIVTVLANEEAELKLLRDHGIRSELCNQNAFLDERRFTVLKRNKLYNAVTNSRMAPYKRIELARDVKDCCLITYFLDPEDLEYEKRIYGSHEEGKNCPMPFMKFPQYENGHYVHYFSIDKINEIYGQSRCGLILSAEEGACFAAMEYLLCGLPVVTTPNIGGRDEFFDKDYAVWAEPAPEAVAEAVEKAVSLPISAEEIRRRTLEKVRKHREKYMQILNDIAREEGVDRDFRKEWDHFFINKMFTNMSEQEAVAMLQARGLHTRYSLLHRLHNGHKAFKLWLKGLEWKLARRKSEKD